MEATTVFPENPPNIKELNEITRKIIGCAYTVAHVLRPGFLERVYHNALAIELLKTGLRAETSVERDVYYDGISVGHYEIDLWVENAVIIEVKAVKQLVSAHAAQLLHYLTMTHSPVGLLINFGTSRVAINRYMKDGFSNTKID